MQKMFYVKTHSNNTVLAVCDAEILNKKFSSNYKNNNIELKVSEHFYKGELKDENEVKVILSNFYNSDFASLNITGNRSIKLALSLGIISSKNIISIDKVMHAQVYLM